MSLNNKYGKCCGCPPRVNVLREVGEWESASIRNANDMKRLNLNSVHDYNDYLEEHGKELIETRFKKLEEDNTCKNSGDNVFFVDSSDFHQRFEEMNGADEEHDVVSYDRNEPRVLSTNDHANYSLNEITNDKSTSYLSSA